MPVDYGGGRRYYSPRQPSPGGTTTTGTTTPVGFDDAYDDIIAESGGGGGTGPQRPPPIGVSEGFAASVSRQQTSRYYPHGYSYTRKNLPQFAGQAQAAALQGPRYRQDDEYAPANMNSNIIKDLQAKLAFVGLYDGNASIVTGDWGEETATAFRRLLAYANQHGQTWQSALAHLRSQIQGGGGPQAQSGRMRIDENGNLVSMAQTPQREPLVMRTTDPRTINVLAREISMNLLGKALSQDEVQNFTAAYNQMEQQRQQEAYDKQLTGGSVVDIPSVEAFLTAGIEEQKPEEVAGYRGLNYMSEAMSMLASPAWGIGR